MSPADPALASTLLRDADLDDLFEGLVDAGAKKRYLESRGREGVLETGIKEVDDVLGRGLRAGRMVGFSGEGVELSLHLLVTSLLTSPTSLAAIIDTTGNLDVLRIYSLLITCLRKSEHLLRTQQAPIHTSNLSTEDVAAKVLERVKIMRVFDFEGVVEAVAEVREGLEGLAVESKDEQPKAHDEEAAQETEPLPVPVHVPRKTVIPDSEDEDEDDEEEEMLLDHPAAAPVSKLLPEAEAEISRPKTPETKQDKEEGEGKVSFLSIDNLAHVLTPMLKKDYMQATVQAAQMLRTLATLTRAHNLHTILSNPVTAHTPRPSASNSPSAKNTAHTSDPNAHVPAAPQPPTSNSHAPKPPSIFTSVSNVPALAHILPRYLDLHILVSRLPRSKADARVMYADGGRAYAGIRNGVEMQTVVEVLADRWGEAVGSWGVLGDTPPVQGLLKKGEEGGKSIGETSGRRSAWGLSWEVVRG